MSEAPASHLFLLLKEKIIQKNVAVTPSPLCRDERLVQQTFRVDFLLHVLVEKSRIIIGLIGSLQRVGDMGEEMV